MRKIKNNPLFITFLVLAITLCFSVAFAKVQNETQVNGIEHRRTVSIFVQSLLNVADREQGGIGERVRVVAQAQNETKDKVADGIDKIQNRSKVKTFLIGTDYESIGQLRSEIVTTRNQIDWLQRLLNRATNEESKTTLLGQIQKLEQEQQKIEDFLKANESKFSLFGWFVKLFNK